MTKLVLGDQPTFTAADLARAYELGRDDASDECNDRGRIEQENYGLTRGAQNFFRAGNIIRALTPPDDLAEKVNGCLHPPNRLTYLHGKAIPIRTRRYQQGPNGSGLPWSNC